MHFALLYILIFEGLLVSSLRVEFFDRVQYDGVFFESTSTQSCTNLPSWANNRADSIRSDACIMLYNNYNCDGSAGSVQMQLNQGTDLNAYSFSNMVSSFHPCNDFAGGQTVRVQFFNHEFLKDTIVADFPNLCGCVSFPNWYVSSVNNFGNCVKLYDNTGCKGSSVTLRGGRSPISEELRKANFNDKTRSLAPCTVPASCLSLTAVVDKFVLEPASTQDRSVVVPMENTQGTSVFVNNGGATISQVVTAEKTISESVQTMVATSFSTMNTVQVSASLSVESSAGIRFLGFGAEKKISMSLQSAYTRSSSSSLSEGTAVTKTEERKFSNTQTFTIPPCTMYNVTSYVKVQRGYPINYKTYAVVSGRMGSHKLTYAELRQHLFEMKIEKIIDLYTVYASTSSSLTVDFGIDSNIQGSGTPIKECYMSHCEVLNKMQNMCLTKGAKETFQNSTYNST